MEQVEFSLKQNAGICKSQIFIVHGHDTTMKQKVSDFLNSQGLVHVILSKQANGGNTILEKFEKTAKHCDYAIVLMSEQDDRGCDRKNIKNGLKPRARQNVILELGYFIGKLGRKKICILTHGNVEIPSDISGFVRIKYSPRSNDWKSALSRELKYAQYPIAYTNPRKGKKKKSGNRTKANKTPEI